MAFDKKPSTWLGAGFASSSGSHTITANTNDAASNKTLTQLTDADADPTTGDIRIVAFALAEALYQGWLAQTGNQPAKMKISRSMNNKTTGKASYRYTFEFEVALPAGSYTVSSE